MITHWMLETQGQTLETVRRFLAELYHRADLDAMLVPLRVGDPATIETHMIDDPDRLAQADPFAPVMCPDAAKTIAEFTQHHPARQLGAVLRSCELRAFEAMVKRDPVNRSALLLIGVDCLGTFPSDDFAWRGDVAKFTEETLRFARQGGINNYRYRTACQMCVRSVPDTADLAIHLLGLPARKMLLIAAYNTEVTDPLHLDEIAGKPASAELIDQHERMREQVIERHARAQTRIHQALHGDLAASVEELIAHLESCEDCRACLEVCPIYHSQAGPYQADQPLTQEQVVRWLTHCVECGLCEGVCQEHYPMMTLSARIRDELAQVEV
jgi:formate dehydrogenase subunit beta